MTHIWDVGRISWDVGLGNMEIWDSGMREHGEMGTWDSRMGMKGCDICTWGQDKKTEPVFVSFSF